MNIFTILNKSSAMQSTFIGPGCAASDFSTVFSQLQHFLKCVTPKPGKAFLLFLFRDIWTHIAARIKSTLCFGTLLSPYGYYGEVVLRFMTVKQ